MNDELPENHNKFWSKDDYAQLKSLFLEGLSVEQIAARLKRNNNSIVSKLLSLNLVVLINGSIYKSNPTLYYTMGENKDE